MRMSKSRLLCFLQCPQKFYLDYVLELRKFSEAPPQGSPLTKGTELHKIFEDYYTLPASKEVESKDDIMELLLSFPEAKKQQLSYSDPDGVLLDRQYFTDYMSLEEEYYQHLSNFADFNIRRIKEVGVDNYAPAYTELSIYNKKWDLLGIIDRIDRIDDGYRVLDYKTGKPHPVTNYCKELAVYKYLVEEYTGEEVTEVGIYFSKNNTLKITKDIEQDYVDKTLLRFTVIRKAIEEEIFPTKSGYLCRWCDHVKYCEDDNLEDLL
jgi:RecB family exonuclease